VEPTGDETSNRASTDDDETHASILLWIAGLVKEPHATFNIVV
jgi:hypothetical protein